MEGFSDWNRFFFSSLTIIFRTLTFLSNFTGVEKVQEDAVPQNDFQNDAARGSMTGDIVLCFANKPKPTYIFVMERGYFVVLKPRQIYIVGWLHL